MEQVCRIGLDRHIYMPQVGLVVAELVGLLDSYTVDLHTASLWIGYAAESI